MTLRANTMPDIDKTLFSGQESISFAEWATLTVPDMSDANISEFLEGSGWDGNVAGVVGLQLSADNSRGSKCLRFAKKNFDLEFFLSIQFNKACVLKK